MNRTIENMQNIVKKMDSDFIKLDSSRDTRAIVTTPKAGIMLEIIADKNHKKLYIGLANNEGISKENFDRLLEEIDALGFSQAQEKIKNKNVRFNYNNMEEDLKDLHDLIVNSDYLNDTNSGWKVTNFDKRISNICKIIELATHTNDTGLLDRFFVDPLTSRVTVNKKDEIVMWGEHVVPIDDLFRLSVDFIKQGGTAVELEKHWESNLKVLYISKELQETIDYKLKLQTTMPEGWKFGDDPMARIVEGNKFLQGVK